MVRESARANMRSHTGDEKNWEDGPRDMQYDTWIVVGARKAKRRDQT